MAIKQRVIYVPGLGDRRSYGQRTIVKFWRLFGLQAHYFPLGWADSEAFEPKLSRLLEKIDEVKKPGAKVYLVGVSAGASAVINAFARREQVDGVVLICGKIQHPETINPRYFQRNPAFKESIYLVSDSLSKLSQKDRAKIMSIHPLYDQTVPISHTIIPGAREKTVFSVGHIMSIFYVIMFRGRMIAKFLKNISA